jgi:hypothetical protein
VSELFSTNDQIASLAITHDGRVMLVENGRRIRVLADNAIRSEPAFQMERATDRIVDIAIDPHFGDTGIVYVAWVEEAVPTRRTLTVSRFREVQNVLGEGVVITSDVPLPDEGDPSIAVDGERRIYVVLPPSRETRMGGQVLRLTHQGTVPWDSGQRSPTLVSGLGVLTAIATEPSGRRLWVAGQRGDQSELMWLVTDPTSSEREPLREAMHGLSDILTSLTVLPAANRSRAARLIGVDTAGRLLAANIGSDAARPEPFNVVEFPYGVPLEAAAGPRQELYVVSRGAVKSETTVFVLKLAPQ